MNNDHENNNIINNKINYKIDNYNDNNNDNNNEENNIYNTFKENIDINDDDYTTNNTNISQTVEPGSIESNEDAIMIEESENDENNGDADESHNIKNHNKSLSGNVENSISANSKNKNEAPNKKIIIPKN